MRVRQLVLLVFAGIVAALALSLGAQAADGGRPFTTQMTGAEEAPGPGDADATGIAEITLNQGLQTICFALSWENIDGTVFAAHIHVAPLGTPGPIVVPLFSGSFAGTDSMSGCVTDVDPDLVKAIRQNPEAYYVNVHSLPSFAAGAIRGQLGK
jgi:CHRD domain